MATILEWKDSTGDGLHYGVDGKFLWINGAAIMIDKIVMVRLSVKNGKHMVNIDLERNDITVELFGKDEDATRAMASLIVRSINAGVSLS